MSSGPVVMQIVLTPERLRQFKALSEEAIQRAIAVSKERIRAVAMTETPVGDPSNYGYTGGRVPGQLKASFDIASTPRSIVWQWTAPYKGIDYAQIVEKGRSGWHPFPARNYAAATKQRALEIVIEELTNALLAIGG